MLPYQVIQMEPRHAHPHAQRFCLGAARNDAAVVVREHHDWAIYQGVVEASLEGDIGRVKINQREHRPETSMMSAAVAPMCPEAPMMPPLDDAQLQEVAAAFRAGALQVLQRPSARMCVALSEPLGELLAQRGVATALVEADLDDCNHVFLRLADGRVLDVTADQFGDALPPVYLGTPTAIHRHAVPFPQRCGWDDLLAMARRKYPEATPRDIGQLVGLTLATSGAIELEEAAERV